MKRLSAYFAGIILLLAAARETEAVLVASATDLWDTSQGTTVIAHSGVIYGSDPRNMFGFVSGSQVDWTVNTLFRDGQPAGTLHSVEWQTLAPITLRSFTLFAEHDGPPRDARYRGFSRFTLFAYNTSTSSFDNELFELFPSTPYGSTPAPPFSFIETNSNGNSLAVAANVVPTTAQRFRAEFVQFGYVDPSASGPRIKELDGFDTFHAAAPAPVPEPATLLLLGSGLVGLGGAAWRRNKKKGSGSSDCNADG